MVLLCSLKFNYAHKNNTNSAENSCIMNYPDHTMESSSLHCDLYVTVFVCGTDADCGPGSCLSDGDGSECECEAGFMGHHCQIGIGFAKQYQERLFYLTSYERKQLLVLF